MRYPLVNKGQIMSESLSFKLELEQQSDYEFRVKFDWPGVDELLLDEPEPLGRSA